MCGEVDVETSYLNTMPMRDCGCRCRCRRRGIVHAGRGGGRGRGVGGGSRVISDIKHEIACRIARESRRQPLAPAALRSESHPRRRLSLLNGRNGGGSATWFRL